MAAPSFRSFSRVTVTATDPNNVLPLPAGLAAGDRIVVVVSQQIGAPAPVAPSGFGLPLVTKATSVTNARVYTKLATSSEPVGGWTWTINPDATIVCAAYVGPAYVDLVAAGNTGNTAYDNERIVYLHGSANATNPTAPTGTTLRFQTGTLATEAGIADVAQSTAGAVTTRIWSGGADANGLLLTLTGNVAPLAPTLLNPPNSGSVDRTSPLRLFWQPNNVIPGDSQSKADLHYRVGTGAWTTLTQPTPNPFYDVAAGTLLDATTYEWQVRTYNSQGTVGPYSASRFFTAGTPPVGLTPTYPVNGGTVGAVDRVDWSVPAQTAYRIRVVADSAGAPDTSTVYYDQTVADPDARTAPLSFPGLDGIWVHILISFANGGPFSAETDLREYVSYTDPPIAIVDGVTVGADSISVGYHTPAPTGAQPAAAYVNIYVLGADGVFDTGALFTSTESPADNSTLLPITGSWTFRTPAGGVDYYFRVETLAPSGAVASTGWISGDTTAGADDLFGGDLFGAGLFGGGA